MDSRSGVYTLKMTKSFDLTGYQISVTLVSIPYPSYLTDRAIISLNLEMLHHRLATDIVQASHIRSIVVKLRLTNNQEMCIHTVKIAVDLVSCRVTL
jgi:hypothetical protein